MAANLERDCCCGPSVTRQKELCRTLLAKLQKLVITLRTKGNDRARLPEFTQHRTNRNEFASCGMKAGLAFSFLLLPNMS
jgi:hypothetical protein